MNKTISINRTLRAYLSINRALLLIALYTVAIFCIFSEPEASTSLWWILEAITVKLIGLAIFHAATTIRRRWKTDRIVRLLSGVGDNHNA